MRENSWSKYLFPLGACLFFGYTVSQSENSWRSDRVSDFSISASDYLPSGKDGSFNIFELSQGDITDNLSQKINIYI